MSQPVALEHWRDYVAQRLALLRSSAAIAAKAADVLLRHKEWLRCQYENELLVVVSSRVTDIRRGVLNLCPRLEACLQLSREFEAMVEEEIPRMQMREEMIKKIPQSDFFVLDFTPVEDLNEVMDVMMKWAEEVAY